MDNLILPSAIVFIVAGLIGGNIEALGVKIPTLKTTRSRIILVLIGILGVTFVAGSYVKKTLDEKDVQDTLLSVHKTYKLGIGQSRISNPESNDIYWVKMDKIKKYDNGLYSMVYLEKPGPGFIVFKVSGRRLLGLWKDTDNKSETGPGLIDLEFFGKGKGSTRIANGWWTYYQKEDEKYYCYLKEE